MMLTLEALLKNEKNKKTKKSLWHASWELQKIKCKIAAT